MERQELGLVLQDPRDPRNPVQEIDFKVFSQGLFLDGITRIARIFNIRKLNVLQKPPPHGNGIDLSRGGFPAPFAEAASGSPGV
jgi:hypothetical protein